jgi:hypothetical protein
MDLSRRQHLNFVESQLGVGRLAGGNQVPRDGVNILDGGDNVPEELKMYHTYYSYYFPILGVCLIFLYLPRLFLRYVKGAHFEIFCAKNLKDNTSGSVRNKDQADKTADRIKKYLTEQRLEHLSHFVTIIMCEFMLVLIATGELCLMDYIFNGALRQFIGLLPNAPLGAIFPDMGM